MIRVVPGWISFAAGAKYRSILFSVSFVFFSYLRHLQHTGKVNLPANNCKQVRKLRTKIYTLCFTVKLLGKILTTILL